MGPATEQPLPEVRQQPQQRQGKPQVRVEPLLQPRAVAPGLKPTSERFMKRNPPVTVDPSMAEEWIRMMEKIFEFVQIEDVENVSSAVYILRNDARIRWDAIKKS